MGLAWPRSREIKKKKKKSHKEHISPKFTKPWWRHRLFHRHQIWHIGRAFDLITLVNFKLDRLRTGCVAQHEILLSFRFSALHRLSPLTQLFPAGPLVMSFLHSLR